MAFSVYESVSNNQKIPVNVFVTTIQNSTYHWHAEYEMIGILAGSINIKTKLDNVILRGGDIFLINPNVIHSITENQNEENLCMFIQISQELFALEKNDGMEIRFYLDSTKGEVPECGFEHFFELMAKIVYESLDDEKNTQFRLRADVCTLIADLFDNVVYDIRYGDIATRNNQELTVDVIEFLEGHLEEEKIVDITCHKFGVSRKSLDRNLKMTIGLSVKEMIENLRIQKAKSLLKNTAKNMNYILDACGFGSEKTFYRVFREQTGLTPNSFRQNGQVDNYDKALKGYLDYETSEVKMRLEKIIKC